MRRHAYCLPQKEAYSGFSLVRISTAISSSSAAWISCSSISSAADGTGSTLFPFLSYPRLILTGGTAKAIHARQTIASDKKGCMLINTANSSTSKRHNRYSVALVAALNVVLSRPFMTKNLSRMDMISIMIANMHTVIVAQEEWALERHIFVGGGE